MLGILIFAAAAGARAQEAALEGKKIAAVRVVDANGQPIPEKLSTGAIQPGSQFDIVDERETIRDLNATGLFSDIQARAVEQPDGLHVDFVVTRNFYNGVLRIRGLKEPPNEATALAALRLPLGQPFQIADLNAGLDRLNQTLQEDGFYEAQASYGLVRHEDTRQMDITVTVVPGRRAKLSGVTFENQTPFPAQQIRAQAKIKKGNTVTAERIDRSTERLRNYLVAAGYLEARVTATRGNYDAKTATLPLTIAAIAGPRVSVEVTGVKISGKEVRKLVPVYAEGDVDPDLLEEGKRNIRDWLQSQGYFDSTVNYTTQLDPNTHVDVIRYTVDRGIRHKLAGVVFEGNRYFSTEVLRSRLQIQPKGFLARGRFSQGLVRADANSIHGLYLSNGFLDSQVNPEVRDDYQGKKGDIFVLYHIVEGNQTHVADLSIHGIKGLSATQTKALMGVIGSTKGQPYSQANVTSDRDNILAYYFDQGYPDAQFEAKVTFSGPDRVNLDYEITEGQRVDVSQVLLEGYRYTRPGIISRQVVVKPGGPLREGDVLATQQKLYNLAIFDRVQVQPQNPDGTYPKKNVVVNVEEGKRYTISYGFGFEAQRLASTSNATGTEINASPLGIFEASKINVGGRGHTASLKLRGSTLEYQALGSYAAPNFLTYPWLNLVISAFADKASYVNTFTARRYEGSVQLSQSLSSTTSLQSRYFYRRVTVDKNTLKVSVSEVPLFSQPTEVSGFEESWVRDRRDNPADATRGNFSTADVSLATKSLGSSATFLRFTVQNSTYTPFRHSAVVFARSTTFGIESAFNASGEDDIPLPERLFAGGGTSLRGFSLNQAGPRDPTTGFPIGGTAMIIFNQEIRFPIRAPFVGSHLGGALFYDAGNVFSDLRHVSLRYKPLPPPAGCQPGTAIQQTLSQCPNLNYFSHTVGFGLRYATPIGPVRVDFGYQLNPASFLSLQTTTTGGITTSQVITSRLPHFQFFFNIGSVF
ncbi:MAG TPA: POTRA domain-containing protein [Candidatus Acidoferrales bacterium]|nr:POTRA domain-containing protein [Candidatus Acidoferrales bacterium]